MGKQWQPLNRCQCHLTQKSAPAPSAAAQACERVCGRTCTCMYGRWSCYTQLRVEDYRTGNSSSRVLFTPQGVRPSLLARARRPHAYSVRCACTRVAISPEALNPRLQCPGWTVCTQSLHVPATGCYKLVAEQITESDTIWSHEPQSDLLLISSSPGAHSPAGRHRPPQ